MSRAGGEATQSKQRTTEQARSQDAWSAVDKVKKNKSNVSVYTQLARSAPSDIQTNGLGQTLAYWKAKGYDHIYDDVSEWVSVQIAKTKTDLLKWIVTTASTDEYRRATTEAMAYLAWLKRFAEAELDDGQSNATG